MVMEEIMLKRIDPQLMATARAQRPEVSGWVRLAQVTLFLVSVIAIGAVLAQ